MDNDVRQCPNCRERSLFRRACQSPEWHCEWCFESYSDEDLSTLDRDMYWEYDREIMEDEGL